MDFDCSVCGDESFIALNEKPDVWNGLCASCNFHPYFAPSLMDSGDE